MHKFYASYVQAIVIGIQELMKNNKTHAGCSLSCCKSV